MKRAPRTMPSGPSEKEALESYELELTQCGELKPDVRVRATELICAERKFRGIGADFITMTRAGGRIIQIVTNTRREWVSIKVLWDVGKPTWEGPSDLEVIV